MEVAFILGAVLAAVVILYGLSVLDRIQSLEARIRDLEGSPDPIVDLEIRAAHPEPK